ncbi:hypothetical protein [Aquincola agrisoli]
MMEDEVVIVACSYRLTPQEMRTRLEGVMAPGAGVRGYVVSASASSECTMDDGWMLLPTDNLDFDFSAYLTGAERVNRQHPGARAIVFVNDTLFTNHAAVANFRALWRQVGLVKALELPAIAGKADLYTTICLRSPWSGLDRYVTTFCFALNRQALALMLQLREMAERDGVTLSLRVDSPAWGAGLPSAFRQFLKANLTYAASPYLWYRLREATFTPEQLSSKARTIYFEHRLSGAIGEVGCVVPTNAGPRWTTYLNVHEWWSRVRRKLGL